MKDIANRQELLNLCDQIRVESKSRLVPLLLTVLGVVLIVVAFMLKDATNISTALLTVGFVVAVVGAIGCVRPGERYIYAPTGEVIAQHKLHHEIEFRPNIECAIADGNIDGITTLRADGSAPLMSICWTTPSGRFFVGQLFQYIPYEYKPQMEPVVIIK